jgi:hypothetical protein
VAAHQAPDLALDVLRKVVRPGKQFLARVEDVTLVAVHQSSAALQVNRVPRPAHEPCTK